MTITFTREAAMRIYSFRPALTLRGRRFKGLRGWAGKPFHPPLTDVPVTAYLLVAAFDLLSALGRGHGWARDLYRAGAFVLAAGLAVSVLAALTGFWDWLRSTSKHTQARRTVNAHATIMLTVTAIALVDLLARTLGARGASAPGAGVLVLSLLAGGLVSLGATYGGSLVYDYGFNVETAGDHPVWHVSEKDVLPGEHG
jgi:uncharacterized membrane protein